MAGIEVATGELMKRVKSKKLRDSARGQDCTVMFAGVCNGDPETVALAHSPFGHTGIGTKPSDYLGAFCCSACHDILDCRAVTPYDWNDRFVHFHEGLVRTWEYWISVGLVKIK